MINYKLINKTDIYETQTEQVIESISDPINAKKRLRHFNLGGGFDGHTPSFILIDVRPYLKDPLKNNSK